MMTKPEKEHGWLRGLVGEWAYEAESPMGPGGEAMKFSGTERVRAVGELWVVAEGRGEMPGGGEATMLLTLGYDPAKKKYVGTWVGSMMAYLWVYEGAVDAGGKALTLETEGPDCMGGGGTAKFREVMEMKGENERVFTSSTLGADGKWSTVMTSRYRRK